jgi:hypothetical protein
MAILADVIRNLRSSPAAERAKNCVRPVLPRCAIAGLPFVVHAGLQRSAARSFKCFATDSYAALIVPRCYDARAGYRSSQRFRRLNLSHDSIRIMPGFVFHAFRATHMIRHGRARQPLVAGNESVA